MRQLLRNAIKCPDGTILESKHRHDFQRHVQEDGREYFVDGGRDYQRIGHSDKEFEDLTVYYDSDHKIVREVFIWGRSLDADGNLLKKPEHILLKDITDDHLIALVKWTEEDYPAYIHQTFINEKEYRGI